MGLLSRAGGQAVAASATVEMLDEMGQALKERLGRLPQKKSTPYTALSLLKAYGAFQAGICLSLNEGNYSSYASVGLGIERLSIPQEQIWSEENAQARYFKLDSQKSLDIKNAEKDLIYWVFPLESPAYNTIEPWRAIMILGALESSGFKPEPVSAILGDVADKMVLPISREASEPDSSESYSVESFSVEPMPEISAAESFDHGKPDTVEEKIALFHQTYLDFNCIVLENPAAEPVKADFCEKVSVMLDKAGTVIPLASDHPLILFPIAMDRELIAHRLSKTLNTKLLLSFEANNPENVITRIESMI